MWNASNDGSGDRQNETPDDRAERIRQRAYELWEAEGRQEGRTDEYWKRAEELIEDEAQTAYPPSASRGNRT
ncbi:DUF2934 domain-containing protein [Chelativorans sp.]|uniref:DUF2934 domain-containing protein n=1 Tax=Chelativorans sp. TaxID=2203393 RepID=UPI0028114308|nr:DUF2934 domain-containing protein [Chelativorans sp.]